MQGEQGNLLSLLVSETAAPVLSVSALLKEIEQAFAQHPRLGDAVVVKGEISNLKPSARGHVYFTLKDEDAAIRINLWASQAAKLRFDLKDGLEVYLTGKLNVYAPQGSISLVAQRIEPVGVGALELAFQQIKEKLTAEGLFDPAYKQDLPTFPERIGIVTSPTGAVIHDMLRVIRRKNPVVSVLLHPARVQGEGAAAEIAAAIEALNDPAHQLDLIIVARGGGSFEDLFCFSEEAVVRAVFNSRLPVVTGIGHEPDFPLSDAAADYTAATPTAAAELAVPDIAQWQGAIDAVQAFLLTQLQAQTNQAEERLDRAVCGLLEGVQLCVNSQAQQLAQTQSVLCREMAHVLEREQAAVAHWGDTLDAFSPLKTLARGYALPTRGGTVLTRQADFAPGQVFSLKVCDGSIECEVLTHGETPS
jgi:exodeoxyribonuclease VII large subunit